MATKRKKPVRRALAGVVVKRAKRQAKRDIRETKREVRQAIRMEVINNRTDHFVLYFERPGRVEVSLIAHPSGEGRNVIAHVYDGTTVDVNQETLGAFDGTIESNVGWTA
jgi:hypothetical protein